MPERVAVFLDYQNVHLTAHGLYALPQTPRHETLIHPLALAERLVAQTARWQRDPRVTVIRRDLNSRGWPAQAPQEKGVDVALAVDLIETALLGSYDVGIVFSGDTDLLPAIEVAFRPGREDHRR